MREIETFCAEWEWVAEEDEDGAFREGELHWNSKFRPSDLLLKFNIFYGTHLGKE